MNCKWKPVNGKFKCEQCGIIRGAEVNRVCETTNKPRPQDPISLTSRFLKERKKWIDSGRPIREEEEIEQIFNICKECPFFKMKSDDAGSCGLCGCAIKRAGTTMNKAAWGTTRCPYDPPKWIESEQVREATKEEAKKDCGCGGK